MNLMNCLFCFISHVLLYHVGSLKVEARDLPGKTSTATIHLKISNPAEANPEFSKQTYTFTVDEDADGQSADISQEVGTVSFCF